MSAPVSTAPGATPEGAAGAKRASDIGKLVILMVTAFVDMIGVLTVSYTHLTLPTIYSV